MEGHAVVDVIGAGNGGIFVPFVLRALGAKRGYVVDNREFLMELGAVNGKGAVLSNLLTFETFGTLEGHMAPDAEALAVVSGIFVPLIILRAVMDHVEVLRTECRSHDGSGDGQRCFHCPCPPLYPLLSWNQEAV